MAMVSVATGVVSPYYEAFWWRGKGLGRISYPNLLDTFVGAFENLEGPQTKEVGPQSVLDLVDLVVIKPWKDW